MAHTNPCLLSNNFFHSIRSPSERGERKALNDGWGEVADSVNHEFRSTPQRGVDFSPREPLVSLL